MKHYTYNLRSCNTIPTETEGKFRFSGRVAVPASQVTLVVGNASITFVKCLLVPTYIHRLIIFDLKNK